MIPNKICLCLPASICYFCCSNPWQYCKEPHLAELLLGTSQIGCIVPPAKSKASHRIPVRKRISYHFKSTEQLFSLKSSYSQADLPIRSFLAGHHRGVESWEVTGGVAKTWTRHATTMGFGFLLNSCQVCTICTCDVTHVTPSNGERHMFTVFWAPWCSQWNYFLIENWWSCNYFTGWWEDPTMKSSKDVLQRLSTTTSCRIVLNSQLYTLHFTHLHIAGKCIPSWHASE